MRGEGGKVQAEKQMKKGRRVLGEGEKSAMGEECKMKGRRVQQEGCKKKGRRLQDQRGRREGIEGRRV